MAGMQRKKSLSAKLIGCKEMTFYFHLDRLDDRRERCGRNSTKLFVGLVESWGVDKPLRGEGQVAKEWRKLGSRISGAIAEFAQCFFGDGRACKLLAMCLLKHVQVLIEGKCRGGKSNRRILAVGRGEN